MTFAYKGFNENTATFAAYDDVEKGVPVEMAESCTVKKAIDGQYFVGVCSGVIDGIAGVQLTGYIEMKYSGTVPSLGTCQVVSNGDGGIKITASGGRMVTVIKLDTEKKTVGFII